MLYYQAFAEVVCSVHDGDTFKLCNGQSIRIWGVNAPELGERGSYAARDYLRRLILGQDVTLSHVAHSYNRIVSRCTIGGVDVAQLLVDKRLVVDWPKYSGGYYSTDK